MPPEDNANSIPSGHDGSEAKTPDGVLPPEGTSNTSGERNGSRAMVLPPEGTSNTSGERNGSRAMVMPPTAPKGKPRAPPLIHGKIKPNEAGK